MKKKLVSTFLCLAMAASLLLTGCGAESDSVTEASTDEGDTATEAPAEQTAVIDAGAGEDATVMPYDDMHNKLLIAVQTGEGAPDISDIELGRFPDFLAGDDVPLEALNDVVEPYMDTLVKSRLEIYSKGDTVYGFPTHVGAMVAFYNTELLEKAGIDYTTIKTWDDFKEAGIKLYDETGVYMCTADTSATWQESILLAQAGTDFVDENGNPQVNSQAMIDGLTMWKDFLDNNVVATIAGGQPDTDEARGEYNLEKYACQLMPLWEMSRYTNYMDQFAGKIAIAPLPVKEGESVMSVGGGGTGTAVTKTAKDVQLAKDFHRCQHRNLEYPGI